MIASLLLNPDVIAAVVTIGTTVVGALKTSEWNQKRKERQRRTAKLALADGVFEAYRQVTGKYKDSGEKLSPRVKTEARARALQFGRKKAAREGVDLDVVLGADYIEHDLEKEVQRRNSIQARYNQLTVRDGLAGRTQGGRTE